ncbi:radical SAM protein [Enterocloster aldenensis]|uniref:4Fe-4S cluster-binding domain-containing protein n=1 Tax=Enterocloster aldenensis TaxID=358742 RepID=UPI000E4BE27C|nr:radical SAM protein [Enterocloster aldenensis]
MIFDKHMLPLITNIQRFSLHDGPGIRTVVFLKGCQLRCPWCSNPENLEAYPQEYWKDNQNGIYGKYLSCNEIYVEVMKDKIFYQSSEMYIPNQENPAIYQEKYPGGITFSGGEALLQMNKLAPLLNQLKENHIHTCIETSLFAPENQLMIAIKYINMFYVDIKILDDYKCKKFLNGCLILYRNNLDILFKSKKPIVFRIPVIGNYTDDADNIYLVIQLIKKYRPLKVEIIKGHNLGNPKYISLGQNVPEYIEVNAGVLETYCEMIKSVGVRAEICKF